MSEVALPVWAAVPAAMLVICAGLLAFIGSLGLWRLKSFYARMHAPTLATTLGTGGVLIASMLVSSALLHRPVVHELLITLFVVLTSPVTAMTLMRAAILRTRVAAKPTD